MIEAILADAVLAMHALFVVWVAAGAIAVWCRPRLAWLHLPALGWGLWIEVSGGLCPLTPLEVSLRRAAGEQGYGGSFVEHYLGALVYPAGLTQEAQWLLAAVLALVNAGLYGAIVHCRQSRRGMR